VIAGDTMDSKRLEAFSDGVFAVAITLLVLNLRVRGPGHGPLAHQFGHLWPAYFALLVSFLVIGVIWVHHHNVFRRVAIVDRPLLALNLVLLLFVIVLPFPTATLANYLRNGGSDSHLAAAVYGLVVEGVALSFVAIMLWISRRGLLDPRWPVALASAAARRYSGGAVAIGVAIGLSFVSAVLALAIHLMVAVFFLVARDPFSYAAAVAEA
jgi:uncharacterized membrane protein